MSNSGRAQDYLMQIVSAGYGFDVPEIQSALEKTNYRSVEAAVEYLFANQLNSSSIKNTAAPSSSANNSTHNNSSNESSMKEIEELKRRISQMEIEGNMKMNVTPDIMDIAIKQNKTAADALNYIMDRYSHLIKPNESIVIKDKNDVNQFKQKLIEEAERKKAEQERDAREKEKQMEMEKARLARLEKEKEEARKRHKERVALNRQKIQKKKQKQKVNKKQATLAWHKRHEEYDKKDLMRLKEIEMKRKKTTQNIDSPEQALQTLFERHNQDTARATVCMLLKIIENICKDPDSEKYRKLNLQNAKIKDLIVAPLGAIKFLEFLGFEEVIEKDEIFPTDPMKDKKYLVYKTLSVNDCKHAILMLNKYNTKAKTIVYDYIEKIRSDDSIQISADDLYMALMYLYTMLNNITISPNSQHLRVIEVGDSLFKRRVGQYPIFQKFLKRLGYQLEERVKGRVLFLQLSEDVQERNKEILYLKNVSRDLYAIAHDDLLMDTTIGIGIKKLYHHNTANLESLYKYFNTVLFVVDNILNEPLNMKYQSVNIEKLKQRYPNIHGIISVLKLFGFAKNKDDKTKFILSENDLDLLKWRKTIFQNASKDKKLLKKK